VIEHAISAAIADFLDDGLSCGFKDQTTGSAKRSLIYHRHLLIR
jgi:hypothetical protein